MPTRDKSALWKRLGLCAASQTARRRRPKFHSNKGRAGAPAGGHNARIVREEVMTTAVIEDSRVTLYRQRLAALLRRPSCRWMSFAVGAAPIHRNFFAAVAAAIEGLPTGGVRHRSGVSHRQVQYGARLRIVGDRGEASYDALRDLLIVPEEVAFDTLDGQAKLIRACVHLGLNLNTRNRQRLDSECAARIAGHLYRLYETVGAEADEPELVEILKQLAPQAPQDTSFFDAAADILRHRRATLRANMRRLPLQPGSFMKIVSTDRRMRLHGLLLENAPRRARARAASDPKPLLGVFPRASRFLALQALQPAALHV
jgi:hypothetical protein